MSTDEVPAGAGAPPDALLFPWTLAHLRRGAGPSLAPSLRLSTGELRAHVRRRRQRRFCIAFILCWPMHWGMGG